MHFLALTPIHGMRVSISFLSLLEEAVQILFQSKLLLSLLIPLGLLLFGSFQVSETLAPLLPESFLSREAVISTFETHQRFLRDGLIALLLFGVLRMALRGPLFLFIEHTVLQKVTPTSRLSLPKSYMLMRSAIIALGYEAFYWMTLTLLALVLFSPLYIASKVNPAAIQILFQMGALVLLGLSLVFFYLKEFGLLYTLLAHLKPRLALDLGRKLFQKHTLLSLLFGLFLMALSLLFTFCLNLAIITSAIIPWSFLQEGWRLVCGVILLGSAALLTETLRLLFFHALAATPRIKVSPTKKILAEEKSIGEAPTA